MSEFKVRRENLFNKMKENSVAIIFAGAPKIKSEDELFPFTSNRNFFYLTGINQAYSALMLIKGIGSQKTYLFIDEYDEVKEKWTGKRLTIDEASEISDINNIFMNSSFENMVALALTSSNNQYGKIDTLYLDLTDELKIKDAYSTRNYEEFIKLEYPNINVENVLPMLLNLRMVKSAEEVQKTVQAITNTNNGINQLLIMLRSGLKEHELSDYFEYYGKTQFESSLAFSTICASGKNAVCLHYPSQNDIIGENDLVLFDLGYQFDGYNADISRTYPVKGTFTGKAKDIYEAVLNCNKAVIDYVREGMTIKDLQEFTKQTLKHECLRLGLLKPEDDICRVYYHNISHHLGLDTHDLSNREKPLENGNIITVEPGLYFKEFGIGVRIEDDVLISNGKGECLSRAIPKEMSDIERLLRSRR